MAQRRPTAVLVASIAAWLLGLSILAIGVSFVIVAVGLDAHQWAAYTPLALGLAYCASGYLLWKGRVSGAVIGAVFAGFVIAVRLNGGFRVSATLLVHVVFVMLVLLAWARLLKSAGAQGHMADEAAEAGDGGIGRA